MEDKYKILVVDDEASLTSNLQDILEAEGYSATVANNGQNALDLCGKDTFDLIITDILLPDTSGIDLIPRLSPLQTTVQFIIITGHASLDTAITAAGQSNVLSYLTKPLNLDNLLALIKLVAQRKRAEEEIAQLARFPSENPYPVLRVDNDGIIIYANEASTPLLEHWKCKVGQILPEDIRKETRDVLRSRKKDHIDIKYQDHIMMLTFAPVIEMEQVNVYGLDITERKLAEEQLRFLGTIPEQVTDSIIVTNNRYEITYINAAAERLFGYSLDELIGKTPDIFNADPIGPTMRHEIYETVSIGGTYLGIVLNRRKNGSTFMCEFKVSPLYDDQGQITSFIGIERDVTQRKQAEENIKRAAEEWRTTFDSITDMVSIHDRDSKLIRVNKAFAGAFNMKPQELIGKTCYELVHKSSEPIANCPHMRTMGSKGPESAECFVPILGIDTEIATSPIFDDKGDLVASVHVARDITERKRMQEQLIMSDRLASVGELASGIAHEVNNPLTSIIGFSDMILEGNVPDDIKDDLEIVNKEAHRAAGVVKNLLTFARKHPNEKQPMDINKAIQEVLALREYEQKISNISVKTRFDADIPQISADSFQLQQVFLNLIINAEFFMSKAHGGGALDITTTHEDNTVRAIFTDDGTGIPEDALEHLFDPFFTTKEVGKGTGLGLSISYGIIRDHNGTIRAESKEGQGASFIIELPLAKGERR